MATPPQKKPQRPFFSSGPTAKPVSWSPETLAKAMTGRSHRDPAAIQIIQDLVDHQRQLLAIPKNYQIGLFLGSNTGAFEAALWNLLGTKNIDVLLSGHFSKQWLDDVQQLADASPHNPNVHALGEPFKNVPNLENINPQHDCVITWHDTPAGAIVPNGDFISDTREGLVLVDATSAAFCTHLPWQKFDAVSWSWQKALGGEPGFGMLALSPRAWQRLQNTKPSLPIPSFLRLHTPNNAIDTLPFTAKPLNTVSMLAVEDARIVTQFAEQQGLNNMIQSTLDKFKTVSQWIKNSPHNFQFLIENPDWRSPIAITITTPDNPQIAYKIASLLDTHKVAFDIKGHAASPPCIRLWNGPTITHEDIQAVLPWIDWAYLEAS